MATCTLTLYKNTKLENSKNDIIEDIEVYLNSLDHITVDTQFQYQRFELDKTIKVNLNQDYQTISDFVTRYNYCSLSTVVDDEPVTYYYFITKATQIAQKTIEFTLRMDTLNTYHYSRLQSAISHNEYKLSPKTTVTREHKDRLYYYGNYTSDIRVQADTFESNAITDWANGQGVVLPATYGNSLSFELDLQSFVSYWNNLEPKPSITWPVVITPNDDMITLKQVSVLGSTLPILNNEIITRIEIGHLESGFYIDATSLSGAHWGWNISTSPFKAFYLVLNVEFANPLQGQTGSSFAPVNGWDLIKNFVINNYVFKEVENPDYLRKVDEYNENIKVDLFKTYDSGPLNALRFPNVSKTGLDWYLVYVTDPDNPDSVKVELYSEQGYIVSDEEITAILSANSNLIPQWKWEPEYVSTQKVEGSQTSWFEVLGHRYPKSDNVYVDCKRTNNSDNAFSEVTVRRRADSGLVAAYTNVASVTFHGYDSLWVYGERPGHEWDVSQYYIDLTQAPQDPSAGLECKPWSEQLLTNPKFIKAFAFPYPVLSGLNNYYISGGKYYISIPRNCTWDPDDECITFTRAQASQFLYQLHFWVDNPFNVLNIHKTYSNKPAKGQLRNIEYESKLYHSDYYQPKFVYDSFSFPFSLELVNEEAYYESSAPFQLLDNFDVTYVVSTNIQSKFAFIFDDYILKKSTQDYDNILTIERNNEKALFNNDYLTYIKSGGYSYDQKKIQDQNITSGITSGITLAAAIGSIIAGASSAGAGGLGVPMLIGGIMGLAGAGAGIVKNIFTAQEQDAALAQKINQLKLQSTTLNGNEDIDILQAISRNRPKIVRYEVSDRMKNAMWDLFHYCGYATNEQKVPHTDTRLYFNFIQADIIYDDYNFNDDIAEDIKNRWAQGVTFFHKVDGGYDIDQIYENFEVSIL